ncbi:MAG: hypothetical protein KGI06_03460 [Candidatus Micrarchaeota archaeon]|nr:hypothetical protein [Candidatus Micrarchaeota archaeon]
MGYKIELGSLTRELGKLKSKEGYIYAGSPNFIGLFGRDSLISSWQLLDYDPKIARDTLIALSKIQGRRSDRRTQEQPGKIPHEYYPKTTSIRWFNRYKGHVGWLKIGRPEYLSVDSTPLFIIVLAKYYEKTGDKRTLARLWPSARRAANWISDYGIYKKFVRYMSDGGKLKSQSWKDGIGKLLDDAVSPVAIVEVQGYSYKALSDMMALMQAMRDTRGEKAFAKMADDLRSNFESAFWMEKGKFYAMAIEGNGRQIKTITSNPGHLLFTGILDGKRADAVARRLFMRDMMTPYGIRTQSSSDKHFNQYAYQLGSVWPHDNWIIAEGLRQTGHIREYNRIRASIIRAAQKLGSIPEYYGVSKGNRLLPLDVMWPRPCDPQAWSLATLISMLYDK